MKFAIFYGTRRPITDFIMPSLRRPVHVLVTYIFQVYFIDIFILPYTEIIQLYNKGILSSLLITLYTITFVGNAF